MKLRLALLTVLLAGVLVWFGLEKRNHRIHEAEQWFLDLLVSNTRDQFVQNIPDESKEVVLVEFRETDKAEYAAWPPAPLDYLMVLKQLTGQQPEVVAIAAPLQWPSPDTQFVSELREAMLPFCLTCAGV